MPLPLPRIRLASAALAALALTGACSTEPAPSPAAGVETPGTERIVVGAATTVIDVRTPAEFAAGHLDGALNLELGSAEFEAGLARLDPAASYVVYCRSGNRSARAAAVMASLGFTDVVDAGGLDQAAAATGLAVTG